MDRRDFLRWTGALAACTSAGTSAFTVPALAQSQATPGDAWMAGFDRAADTAPWALAYRSATGDLAGQATQLRGRFPAAVQGLLYRNGPAVHDMGGQRYHNYLDGDGMVQRFAIGAATVAHTGKIVRTPKYLAEAAAGKRVVEGFASKWHGLRPITGPDSLNTANTSVLHVGGELLALWEGGSAFSIDPLSLDTGAAKVWRDDLKSVPFSAHPRVDADGTVWNFGVSMVADMLVLYEIGADGRLRRAQGLKVPQISMVHDFAITQNHLVFLLPPLVLDKERVHAGRSFLDSHVWRPELGMRVLVVDKADWSRRQWLELPAGFVFHLGNAWDDGQGVIRLDYAHTHAPDVLFGTDRELMRGRIVPRPDYALALVRIDTVRKTASQELLHVQAEFPQLDRRLTGLRHRHLLHATQTAPTRHPGFSAIARTNVETGRSEVYSYGEDHMVEEHLFVPEIGSAPGGKGWVVGTALDLKGARTIVSAFDADRLGDGPVAQAALPYALPLGLHGVFMKA